MDHPGALRHPADGEAVDARPRPASGACRWSGSRSAASRAAVGRRARGRPPASPASDACRAAAARRSRRSRGRAPPRRRGRAAAPPRPRSRARRARRARPVAAFATPELTTTACGSARLEVLLRDEHRRRLDAVDGEHRRADRRRASSGRARGPSSLRRMPAWTPAATKPFGGGDAHTSTPGEAAARPSRGARARGSRSAPPGRRRPCRGCRARRRRSRVPVGAVGEDADLGRVGALHARRARARRPPAARVTAGCGGVGRLERARADRRRRSAGRSTVAISPRRTGSRCGTKQTGKPSACSISGACWCAPTRYGDDVLEHGAGVRARPSASRPAPETPDFASTTTPSGSIASASGASASSAAVA